MEPLWKAACCPEQVLCISAFKRKNLHLRFAFVVTLLLMVPLCLSGGDKKKKAPEQFCSLSFVVLKDSNGKPIKNASVVIHSLDKNGNQGSEGFQLKTDTDGRASIDDIPYGNLRVQVIAHSFQTYGDDIVVNAAKQELVIRLKPPAEQLSVYQ
jgi:5-hydroxyisourate hydrolase-like protein (transthyretin family)